MTRTCTFALAFLISLGAAARAAQAEPAPLVVVIVIDQFRADYIDAFRDYFGEGGFKRVLHDGAWFSNAHLEYGTTATGPGHASMLTGTPPAVHGIVANDWKEFDGKAHGMYCCGDDGVRILGLPEGARADGRSPRNLRSGTVGDAMRSAFGPSSRIWTVAIKDRAAILMGGRSANGAVWFDDGNFVTSSYYGSALPDWAATLNRERVADRYFKKTWDRLLPSGLYGPRFVVAAGKKRPGGDAVFPKTIGSRSDQPDKRYYSEMLNSPFGDDLVLEAARRVVTAEQLGRDEVPDLLCVGCSSNDIVGHAYGPDSDEVMDMTLRTDRQLAEFLSWLDEKVGKGRYLLAITADHGVGPLTEWAEEAGLGGGRLHEKEITKSLNERLAERFHPESSDALVAAVNLPWIYLNEPAVRAAGLELDRVARAAADAVSSHPGIARAVAVCDLPDSADGSGDDLLDYVRNSYYPGRAGHVYAHWSQYWYKGSKLAGHGAAYEYDQHVPVLLMGAGVQPGHYTQAIRPTGMAATLCALLGIAPPAPQCTAPLKAALAASSVASR